MSGQEASSSERDEENGLPACQSQRPRRILLGLQASVASPAAASPLPLAGHTSQLSGAFMARLAPPAPTQSRVPSFSPKARTVTLARCRSLFAV